MQNTNSNLTLRDIIPVILLRLPRWICLFIIAGMIVVTGYYFSKDHNTVSAEVNFSYDGIESGLDPSGNRFDELELKSEDIIREAANAMEMDASPDAVNRLRAALGVRGSVPESIFNNIIDYQSIFGSNNVGTLENVREASYFPSRYTLTFHYEKAGFSAKEGIQFLHELLIAYEKFFYEQYGYNHFLENAVTSLDYRDYDYISAVKVLDNRLQSLRDYLLTFVTQDNTRFVSNRTGYSFSDIIDSLDTIRVQDINWITSYIISNNATKDRQMLIDYYRYKIEDAGRELNQRQSRLYTLNEQIDGYVKTSAVFFGAASGTTEQNGSTSSYELPQQSAMYNALINEKVSCETAISETQERISMYEQRAERLVSGDSISNSEITEIVEAELKRIDDRITQCLADTNETTDEFFRTVILKRAFQVLREPEHTGLSMGQLIRDAFLLLEMVEATLLGLFVLTLPGTALAIKKRKQNAAGDKLTELADECKTSVTHEIQNREVDLK